MQRDGAAVTEPRVLAIVLTHNAPGALDRCLAAISEQTRRVDDVLVVDNASDPPAAPAGRDLPLRVLRRETNDGPGGGHRAGLEAFLVSGADMAWVMDDDCVPDPGCLAALLDHYGTLKKDRAVLPLWVDGVTGVGSFLPAWCGFLLSATLLGRVGLPRAEFVWWAEDTEFLQSRMIDAGLRPAHAPEAVVTHLRVRTGPSKPAWKYYYETRNTIVYRVYFQRLTWWHARLLTRSLVALLGQILIREDHKIRKIAAFGRGVLDGATRRMGMRVPLP
jgi:GT2 family glycosyltransferase